MEKCLNEVKVPLGHPLLTSEMSGRSLQPGFTDSVISPPLKQQFTFYPDR